MSKWPYKFDLAWEGFDQATFETDINRVADWIGESTNCGAKISIIDEGRPARWLRVWFKSPKDATLFKLFFSEFILPPETPVEKLGRVILPIIRRVMPNVIANDILGVQDMTGPTGTIFALRPRYDKKISPSQVKARRRRAAKKYGPWVWGDEKQNYRPSGQPLSRGRQDSMIKAAARRAKFVSQNGPNLFYHDKKAAQITATGQMILRKMLKNTQDYVNGNV